ncbi:hypothetical protein FRB99_006994 [Tulasnella sp. 403]|nr:hypothetical protein FRB99_006994 [Tulasnella sp. 403]
MADPRPQHEEGDVEIEGEAYIDPNEVLAEVTLDDDDAPMDDADGDDDVGDDDEGPREDNSIQHFAGHSASVFAVSAHPTQPLVASGGEDDLGYIWNVTNGEEVVRLSGHTDSVINIEWSFDGEMVASGGMDGRVRIWRRVGKTDWKNWEFLTELQGPDEVKWLRWHPKGNVLLSGSNDGTVWLWQLPSGNTMQVFAGHEGPVETGQFTPDGKRIITGDGVGTLIYWDPRGTEPVWKMTPNTARFGMHGGITSVATNPASTIAVVGGAEGELRVVNLAKGEVIGVLEGHQQGESVEAITFVDWSATAAANASIVATGATDGKICIWDLTSMKLRYTLTHSDSITSIQVSPSSTSRGHHITSSSQDKTLKTWDTRTGQLLQEHLGHRGPVLGASVGAFEDFVYVISAGDDGACLDIALMANPSTSVIDPVTTTTAGHVDIATVTDDATLATLLPSHPSQRSNVTVWTFSNDNPNNTRILDSNNEAIYEIKPDFEGKRTMTNMRRLKEDGSAGAVFGYIEWHDYTPDKICFNGGEKIRKGSFFSSAGPMSYAVTFKDTQGRRYTWKGLGAALQLALHANDSVNPKLPIAMFQKSRYDRSVEPPEPHPAQLFLTDRAMEVKELVLFTFLVLEKGRRTKEASEDNRMSSMKAEASMGIGDAARSIGDGVGAGVKRHG